MNKPYENKTHLTDWDGPKHMTRDIDKYTSTIDDIGLEIIIDKGQLEGHIEDNHDINNWLCIYYDTEIDRWRYIVPGKLPYQPRFHGYIKLGLPISQIFDSFECLAKFMEILTTEVKNVGWERVISESSNP